MKVLQGSREVHGQLFEEFVQPRHTSILLEAS